MFKHHVGKHVENIISNTFFQYFFFNINLWPLMKTVKNIIANSIIMCVNICKKLRVFITKRADKQKL